MTCWPESLGSSSLLALNQQATPSHGLCKLPPMQCLWDGRPLKSSEIPMQDLHRLPRSCHCTDSTGLPLCNTSWTVLHLFLVHFQQPEEATDALGPGPSDATLYKDVIPKQGTVKSYLEIEHWIGLLGCS